MKVSLCLALILPSVAAFAPQPSASKTVTSLKAASSIPPSGWQGKPLNKHESSPSVAPKPVTKAQRQSIPDVMIEPDYYLTWAVALLGPLIMWYHPSYAADGTPSLIGIAGGAFHILFAALLWVQTRRVRLVFEKDHMEFYNIKGPHLDLNKGAWLEKKPDNYVAGTSNRWNYDTITNYGFFPSLEYPVICYFKETETSPDQWNKWFAAFDSYGRGQPHFFPGICNARQIKEQFELRGIKRKSVPKLEKPQGVWVGQKIKEELEKKQ